MNTQYRKNLKAVATACKNYTDSEIKKSEERILSIVARNNVDFIDHTDEATYRFTAPANAKLLMLQSEAGNSVKYSPSVASDNNATHIKTLPSTVYDLDVSKVEGVGYKVNQLVGNLKATFTTGGVTFTNNGDGSMTLNGTATEEIGSVSVGVDVTANITFPRRSHKVLVTCNNTLSGFYIGVSGYSINNSGAFFFNESNPTDWTNGIGCHIVAGTVFNNFKIIPQVFELTADFGSGNEPSTVSDCESAYLQRGINIYEYTPQQSSIKNNAFTGVTIKDSNDNITEAISVDLTTIKDSNNVSLFPSGKLMGNSNVADFIAPYNQESRWNEKKLKELDWNYYDGVFYAIIADKVNDKNNTGICNIYIVLDTSVQGTSTASATLNDKESVLSINTTNPCIYVKDSAYGNDTTAFKNHFTNDDVIQYERATYLTSNTDLTSLTKINAQSNGTITLNNTDNVDMPNLISYNGVIKHALATAVKQDGFNIWDEETELGYYGTNGFVSNSSYLGCKNLVYLNPNTTYYLKAPNNIDVYAYVYDINGQNGVSISINVNSTFTMPSGCYYLGFAVSKSQYGTTYHNDICINISGTLNGTYKPHKPTITRLLPNSEAKYSLGITDGVRNTRVFCDDEGNAVNEGQLDVGNQDLSGLNWSYASGETYPRFTVAVSGFKMPTSATTLPNVLCAKYEGVKANDLVGLGTSGLALYNNYIYVRDTNYTNATIFKTAMSGEILFYEKNATDTETLDDFDYFFDCEEGDTFTIIGCELLQCYATYSFLIKEAKSNE